MSLSRSMARGCRNLDCTRRMIIASNVCPDFKPPRSASRCWRCCPACRPDRPAQRWSRTSTKRKSGFRPSSPRIASAPSPSLCAGCCSRSADAGTSSSRRCSPRRWMSPVDSCSSSGIAAARTRSRARRVEGRRSGCGQGSTPSSSTPSFATRGCRCGEDCVPRPWCGFQSRARGRGSCSPPSTTPSPSLP